ncbi:glycosyl hydrolase [Cantharellus anzutake]|uniref:glycosyl hydrolase n=1 Tax=Cantharellus anzutake TaxID=1750568 RepID=UPI001906A65D|nr:glycosyl hydrolase [Cantharellus anzutake]KAF8325634.1 glycosyl hydrolase [Cantharellus anzutake]
MYHFLQLVSLAVAVNALFPLWDTPGLGSRGSFGRANNSSCSLDQSKPPGDLTACGNSTLFFIWRPKARFIAPEGWQNDPQGHFQRADGSFHAGYQCNPQHLLWGNISQCSAYSKDLVTWIDLPRWEDPRTMYPDRVYDIRGVFDGSMIIKGWNSYPTTIYAATTVFPLGADVQPPEQEGTETQALAYTTDGGATWVKLNFGVNPVIYKWPMTNLTGFRDPYAFESPILSRLLRKSAPGNSSLLSGDYFLTISSGLRPEAYPDGGPRLFLYRQTYPDDVTQWTYLGPVVSLSRWGSFSPWSGNAGSNFETAAVTRLNEHGHATDAGTDPDALDIITYGTELGRDGTHEDHWPLWSAVDFNVADGSVQSTIKFAGVLDWGRAYAFTFFPVTKGKWKRMVMVGWTYEDDEDLVLTKQRGYQGAFTLYRDLFVKVIRNVDSTMPGLHEPSSWGTRTEPDGSISVVTLGQRVIPEILGAYKAASRISKPQPRILSANRGYVPFAIQPSGKHYAVMGTFNFPVREFNTLPMVGFRVLASDSEWTDVYYDPANESIVVQRDHHSLINSYGNEAEYAKLRLYRINSKKGGTSSPEPLVLSVFVDGSIVEVYANDQAVITTRAYPWLAASKGVGFVSSGGTNATSVRVSDVELWDGLLNAWPERPVDTRKPLIWDGPLPSIWKIWVGW